MELGSAMVGRVGGREGHWNKVTRAGILISKKKYEGLYISVRSSERLATFNSMIFVLSQCIYLFRDLFLVILVLFG